ncbi:MAG: HEPN domain-containing protein [Chloroflexi bacterium]|nr:HEPN domain-containing protein [Chloroflexota bacterium]MCY3938418.1 HEPN domain-containing protein [Chloroflexota bacterium]
MNDLDPAAREASRWLRFSAEDLDVASRLLSGSPSTPRHACWLAQQAAEKALKAALILERIEFPYTHDLDALCDLLPGGWPVKDAHTDLAGLTQWAAEARYPRDWPEPTNADAVGAESEARSVHNSVAAEFGRRGVFAE